MGKIQRVSKRYIAHLYFIRIDIFLFIDINYIGKSSVLLVFVDLQKYFLFSTIVRDQILTGLITNYYLSTQHRLLPHFKD